MPYRDPTEPRSNFKRARKSILYPIAKGFGARLVELVRDRGDLWMVDVAAKLQVTPSYLSKLIRGEIEKPTQKVLRQIIVNYKPTPVELAVLRSDPILRQGASSRVLTEPRLIAWKAVSDAKKLSDYDIAAKVGVSRSIVSRWLSGQATVPPARVEQINKVLGL